MPPLSVPFDLASLSDRDVEVSLSPSPAERAAMATWLDASTVENLSATVRLSRLGEDFYEYTAMFAADVVQPCVVSLEPVHSHLTGSVSRQFRVSGKAGGKTRKEKWPESRSKQISEAENDELEILPSPILDLAAPILEELSLAIDPYPRAKDAQLELPAEAREEAANPFAVLAKLKAEPGKADTRKRRERSDPEQPPAKSAAKPRHKR